MNLGNHERRFMSCCIRLAVFAVVTMGAITVQASDEGVRPVTAEAAARLGEAAAGAAFGPVEPVGVTSYWDPDMAVSAYAIEYARKDDGSAVTVIASARRDDVPIPMMWRGVPKHSDPAVLADARRHIENAVGVAVSEPAGIFWLDTYELWARFPELNPQTGQAIICNLYTGQITTLEELQAKWQNRQRNVLVGGQASISGVSIASAPQPGGRTAAQAKYIEDQWVAVEDLLAGGTAKTTNVSIQAAPHYTQYVSGVPNLNERIPWDGQDWDGDSQIVAAMDVLLFWDTRGYDRLVDGEDLDAVHGDLRQAMLWDRGTGDPNAAAGLRQFINGLSYANQYSFTVDLLDMWASPPYVWPSFSDCRREIDNGRPVLFGVKSYTDDPTNPTDYDYRDQVMCAVGYFEGYPFSDRTSAQWVVVHDNWGGGDAADPYRLDDEPFIDWNRATDSLIRAQPGPSGDAVTYPSAAGITWRCGESQLITWSGFTGSLVKIELYRGSSLQRTIAASTDNDGSYPWTVPGTQTAGANYRIRITSISNSSQDDDSDNDFTISEPMRVVYPSASGITWDRGTAYEIAWTGFPGPGVTIELCRGLVVERTIVSTGNTGSYVWTVPNDQRTGTDYRIKITSTSDTSQYDFSDDDFAIADVPEVMYPTASGVALGRAIAYTITWDGFDAASVMIELYKGSRQYSTIVPSTGNTGSYAWTVPATFSLGTDYRIKITSASDASQYDYSDEPFEIKDVATVTYPTNAGVALRRGESSTITWAGFAGPTVRIDLYKGSSLHRTIASSTSNNGAYPWTIPGGQTLGADFKVRIISNSDSTQTDDSDNFFTIADPRVTYPTDRGVTWKVGESRRITWTGFVTTTVQVDLYQGRTLVRTIASSIANSESYTWTIPSDVTPGSDFTIRITSMPEGSQYDESDNVFTIANPRVTYPTDAGVTWRVGESRTINWSGFNGSAVKIELYKGSTLNRTIASSASNSGSYAWTIPGDQVFGSDFKIRITSTSDSTQTDDSDNYFTIANPRVTYPTDRGVTWKVGQSYRITWTGFVASSVQIDLYQGRTLVRTIASFVANSESYTWTIPSDQTPGSDFTIRITSTTDSSQYDESDNVFAIINPRVTYPTDAGVTWRVGESRTITWSGFNGSAVKIELYKGSTLNRTITSSASNSGSYAWTVPGDQTSGSDFKIRITSTSDSTQTDDSDNVFTIVNPRVTYPTDRGVVWKVGESRRITWTGFITSSVRIELYQGRTLVRTIASSTANSESYTWTIPSDQTPGLDFTIRITSTTDSSQYDESDNVFAIINPRVTYPTDAGVSWRVGESRTITWTGFDGSNVRIELYKGSTLNRTIASSTTNNGSYAWTVPGGQTLGLDFKIRITSTSDSTQTDDSDNYFTIADPRVTYPTDPGVAWKVGESRTITWTGFVGSSVRIELYQGRTLNRTIASSTSNDGSHPWTIPSDQAPGADYTIRITSLSDSSLYDESDNAFTISNPRVLYPTDRGITWKVGESPTITWAGFNGSSVTIELFKGSTLNRTIASSTSNDGSYPWTIPGDQTLGADFKIRITSTSDSTQSDDSDNYFTIADPRVTYPTDAGITWRAGDSTTITWTGFVGTNVKIDLYKGSTLNRTIAASAGNSGSYSWTVPTDQTAGSDFKIRITCTSDALQSDDSDNELAIINPRVTYPTATGVTWGRGGTYTITWDGFSGRFVAIELYKGGVLNRTIEASVDNNGSYGWTVPADQVVGTDFKIRVTVTSDPSQSDESDNPFTISDEPCPVPVALWRFEPTNFTNDSVGTNHLDNDGASVETTDRKEGDGCAYLRAFERDSLMRYDDHLSPNFPTKSGTSNPTMTLCFWMKPKSFPFNATVISKYQIATDTRSWRLYLGAVPGNYLKLGLGRGTGGDFTDYSFSQTNEQLVVNHWYHVAFVYRNSDRYYHVRIWDDTDHVVRVNREGTATAPIAITNAPLIFGNTPLESMYFDGLLDEVAVFKDVLTTSQIDKIRTGACRLY